MKKDYSLDDRPGSLTLYGGPYTLSMPTCPTLVLRKQQHWPVIWETQLDFQPNSPRVESGTAVWWNYTCFASIGIALQRESSQNQRIVRFSPPSNHGEAVERTISTEGKIILVIECTATNYRLGFREAQDKTREDCSWLGEIDTQILTRNPEIGQSSSQRTGRSIDSRPNTEVRHWFPSFRGRTPRHKAHH